MSYIPLLTKDEHIVITLKGPNVYERFDYEYINLDKRPLWGVLSASIAIRKIIRDKKIDIVHSHSYWTNIISRLATGKKPKLINNYHFADYETMKQKRAVKKMIFLDRITGRKTLIRVGVSQYVATILNNTFPGGDIRLIPNFIQCKKTDRIRNFARGRELKIVAVGNCNLEKNYGLVLQAFAALREEPISLDIFGGGDRLAFYRDEARRMALTKVRFCGIVPNAREHLINYDLFLSASISETFGLAVLEAMCAGLPLLISDIPAFNEIAPTGALFFNPYDKDNLVARLKEFLRNPRSTDLSVYDTILQKYSSKNYLAELTDLYNS
jgi:glycosyltransferase involved in cell wall biosynthesis